MSEHPELKADHQDYPTAEKLHELELEIRFRKQVYPGQVKAGKKQWPELRHRLNVMRAIARDYAAKIKQEGGL